LVVAGFPPSAPGGGAAVTRQVLSEWPENSLHWWCPYPPPAHLRGRNVSWPTAPTKLFPQQRLRWIKTKLTQLAWVPLAVRSLRQTVADVSPEVIWCIPHEWTIPVADTVLPRRTIPYAIYLQDYPTTEQLSAIVGTKTTQRWMQSVENLVRHASFVDTTSYPMGDDILRRTGRASTQMLHEGLESGDFERLSQASASSHSEQFTLAFAGTVVAEKAFAETMSELGKVRQSLAKPLHIEFYSPHTYAQRPWFDPVWMSERGYKDRRALVAAMQQCQAGLIVMDIADTNRNYNRFSFPTKFITYIAAGIEPMVVAHESSAVAALAKESGIGLHFGDPRALAASMARLTGAETNPDRAQMIEFARRHFDAAQKRRRFREKIFEAVGYA